MAGEILIIIVGFFRWALKGFKTDLKDEISGNKKDIKNIRGQNYLIGLIIIILLILLFVFL
jgi:Na+/H+ antiporter NhaC